jgi:hypothetical protein
LFSVGSPSRLTIQQIQKKHETEGPWLAPTNRTDADCLALVVVLDGFASARRKWFTEVSASSSSSDGV